MSPPRFISQVATVYIECWKPISNQRTRQRVRKASFKEVSDETRKSKDCARRRNDPDPK